MSSQPQSPHNHYKPNPYLTPSYLINLSAHIQTLSSFYQQQNLPSLAAEYKSFLQSTFKGLSDALNVFTEDENMIISSMISTKVELDVFVGEKLFLLLEKETGPLAEVLRFVLEGYKKNAQDYDELLIRERKRKIQFENEKNDRVVNNLKKQVLIKREYVKDLQQRIRDLQQENSKIYQKIIDNAKNTISSTLIQTKNLTSSQQFLTPGKYSKQGTLSSIQQQQGSPIQMKISHKQLSLKQVQETILEILYLKRKQQSISQKRTSMRSYIRYYFKYKFGLSELCQEMRTNFVSAVKHFLTVSWEGSSNNRQQGYSSGDISQSRHTKQDQQKPLLLMFQKMIQQQIDQNYYWTQYIPKGIKIIKLFKRYLHEKQKIQIKQLDRLYDGYEGISGTISNYSTNKIMINEEERKDFELDETDVRNILGNVYAKSREVETLQMIFGEMIGGRMAGQADGWMGGKGEGSIILQKGRQQFASSRTMVLSKHLLGIIMCYQIESYAIKLATLTNAIRKYSLTTQWVTINYTGVEKVILEMKIDQERYLPYLQQNYQEMKDKEFTYSEVVEIVDGQICGERMEGRYGGMGYAGTSRKY